MAKARKPNFTEKEKLLLLSEWEKRQDVLRPKFSSKITSQAKHNAWREIADTMNACFPSVRCYQYLYFSQNGATSLGWQFNGLPYEVIYEQNTSPIKPTA